MEPTHTAFASTWARGGSLSKTRSPKRLLPGVRGSLTLFTLRASALPQPVHPSPGKVKLAASGKRGTGGIRWAQQPRPGFSALTPMATEKYLFPVDGLQWLLKPTTGPPSEGQVIREIKIDPLHT